MEKRNCNVEVFSRVTGFFRPVQSWNKGKTEEFGDRKKFDLKMDTNRSERSGKTCVSQVTGGEEIYQCANKRRQI